MTQVSKVSTVKFIQKGETGKPGPLMYPAGKWNEQETYTRTADTCPFVLYDTGDPITSLYYFLTEEGTYYYVAPDDETQPEKAKDRKNYGHPVESASLNGVWKKINNAGYVFANFLMADHALLAGAVAYDNKLFSQSGTTSNYTDPDFEPNLSLDWKNGTLECNKAKITGEIHADKGTFKGDIYAQNGSFQTTTATNKDRIVIDANKQMIALINKSNIQTGKWHFSDTYSMITLSGNVDSEGRSVIITPNYLGIYKKIGNSTKTVAYISQESINFNPEYMPTKDNLSKLQKGDFYRDGEFVKIKL